MILIWPQSICVFAAIISVHGISGERQIVIEARTPRDSNDEQQNVEASKLEAAGASSSCPEYEWNGVQILSTLSCFEFRAPCPDQDDIFGTITQKCSCTGDQWIGTPNTNNCTHKWIRTLNQAIDSNDPVENITLSWTQMLRNTMNNVLYGGDIVGSVEMGERLLNLARMQYSGLFDRSERSFKVTQFTMMFGNAGDQLLSTSAKEVWLLLDEQVRILKASTLMGMLEQSAALISEFTMETEHKFDYSNWAMEVQIKKPSEDASAFGSSPSINDDVPSAFSGMRSRMLVPTPAGSSEFDADSNKTQTISFTGFSFSPILKMPSLTVLENSSRSASQIATFDDSHFSPMARGGASPFGVLDRNPLRLGYYIFKSVGSLLVTEQGTVINSLVIGASVNNPNKSLALPADSPVTFKFYHLWKDNVTNPRCVFWDSTNRSWSEKGCNLLNTSAESTDCSCTHLTSFAILMDITGSYSRLEQNLSTKILDWITVIGCIISIICLTLAFCIFSFIRSLWSTRHTIHRNLCLCLLLAELVFVFGIDYTSDIIVCRSVAIALHYLFLAAFCWMLLEGYQLYLMLIQVFETEEVKIILYYLYAYGFPAVVVAVTAGVAFFNYGTPQYCWLNVETPTIWAFVGPIAVVIVSNLVFLGVALRVVLSVRSRDRTRLQQLFGWLKGSATLLCLLGVTWIFGYLMVINGANTFFAYIFTILNCLQGLFIFVIHVILNEKVRTTVIRFIRVRICCMSDSTASGQTPSVLSSGQKLMKMMRSGDSSRNPSSQPSTNSTDYSLKSKTTLNGESIDKVVGCPATMITYLEWKKKVSEFAQSDGDRQLLDEKTGQNAENLYETPIQRSNSDRSEVIRKRNM